MNSLHKPPKLIFRIPKQRLNINRMQLSIISFVLPISDMWKLQEL